MRLPSIFSICTATKVLLFASTTLAFAQQNAPGQWVGDLYSISHRTSNLTPPTVLIDDKNHVHLEIPNLATIDDFPVPRNLRMFAPSPKWRNDVLYVTTLSPEREKDKDGNEFSRVNFAKWQDGEWRFLGWLKTSPTETVTAIPCDNDRFIVISRRSDLSDNNRADRTPFHLVSAPSQSEASYSRLANFYPLDIPSQRSSGLTGRWLQTATHPDGRRGLVPYEGQETPEERAKIFAHQAENLKVRLISPIDHGQDDIRKHMSDPAWFGLASRSTVAMTDEYAVVVSRQTGLYWVFSLENAALRRTGNVFRKNDYSFSS